MKSALLTEAAGRSCIRFSISTRAYWVQDQAVNQDAFNRL